MKHIIDYIKRNPLLLLLILPAFFIYLLIIFPSGSNYCFNKICGIYFWGVHGHDAIWHLAIASTAFQKLPFIAPTYAGASLTGYNYFLDLVVNLISRTGIPAITVYFKILPVAWFVIYTSLLITLARKIKDNPLFVGLFLCLAYFAESFSYLITLFHKGTIWGSAGVLATLKVHMMSNLPFAFSVLIFLIMLIIIKNQKTDAKTIIILGILNFFNLGLKFYGGIISIFLIGIYIFFSFVRKDFRKMLIYAFIQVVFVGAAVMFFYDPFSSLKTGAIFTVSPFSLVHTITEEPNLVYLRKITDARYFLVSQGIGPRLIAIELFNLFLFLFFYLGIKFFGLVYAGIKLIRRKLSAFEAYVLSTIGFATLLMITFVQKAEWWNTVQFFYYAIFLSVIFTAELAYQLWKKSKWLLIIMIVLAVPVTFDVIREYAAIPGSAYVPARELSALDFLRKQPSGVVFSPLYDTSWKKTGGPNELFRYADTAYVAAFTGKPVYFANILQLRLTGVDYAGRLETVRQQDCNILDSVNYVYEIKAVIGKQRLVACPGSNIKRIFDNQAVSIYSVTK